jgi:hypothetical protein
MIRQATAQDRIPFSVIVVNWLSRLIFYHGAIGTLAVLRLAGPSRHAQRHVSLSALFSTPNGVHLLLILEAWLILITSLTLFDEIKRRRKPRFRPAFPDAVRKRGQRKLAMTVLVYLVLFASMTNPALIDWRALAVTLAMGAIGWPMISRSSKMLPQAPPLTIDPLSPDFGGSASPAFPSSAVKPASGSTPSAGAVIAETSAKQSASGKRTSGRLWLNEENSRMLVSERPKALRMLGRGMAVFMLAGAFYLAWIPTQFRHPAPFFFYLMPFLALFCCVMLLSEASPQRLEIDLVGRTYRYSDYRPIMQGWRLGATIMRWPFVTETRSGVVSEDFQGVGVRVFYGKGTTYYVNLIWNDSSRSPITLGMSSYEDKARPLMEEAAEKLSLPALGRILPK